MVRPHQVGPNLPSGLRRPDRSVDLRNTPVQQMGLGVFNWGGYGNPPEIWTRGSTGSSWNITSNAEAQRFLEAAAEQMRRDDRDDAPPPDAPLEEIIDPVYGYLGRSPRYIALPEGGGIDDNAPEPGEGEERGQGHASSRFGWGYVGGAGSRISW